MWQRVHNDTGAWNTKLRTWTWDLTQTLKTKTRLVTMTLFHLCQALIPCMEQLDGRGLVNKVGLSFTFYHHQAGIVLLLLNAGLSDGIYCFSLRIRIFFNNLIYMFSVLLIDTSWVDRLIFILLQRGRLSPSVPLLLDAPGNHVIQPCFIPDASSDSKEETGSILVLTSN